MSCEFEVGQKVVCYRPPEQYKTGERRPGGAGWENGRIFTIHSIDQANKNLSDGRSSYILWPGKGEAGIYHCYVKHVDILPKEMFEIS